MHIFLKNKGKYLNFSTFVSSLKTLCCLISDEVRAMVSHKHRLKILRSLQMEMICIDEVIRENLFCKSEGLLGNQLVLWWKKKGGFL